MPVPRLMVMATPPPQDEGSQPDDAALAQALVRREAGATFTAWTRLHPVVDATLRRLMGPDAELADLSQEVFLRFFGGVAELRDPKALRSFMFGICLRVVRRELRHRWLRRFLRLTATGDAPDVLTTTDDPDAREVVRRYYAALDRIGGDGRSIFIARNIERLPMAEVAALHGLSVSTTQRRLARVTRRMDALADADPVLAAYLAQTKQRRTP
jgi:RNA polymerase sigma-70 factor, ECF subfamily